MRPLDVHLLMFTCPFYGGGVSLDWNFNLLHHKLASERKYRSEPPARGRGFQKWSSLVENWFCIFASNVSFIEHIFASYLFC